jgi:SAM-dependent methyltransferase
MNDAISRQEGRDVFGRTADSYHCARPDYPERMYRILVERCRLRGARTLEVGAGSGIATRRLLELGVQSLVAVEPDPVLSKSLDDLACESPGRVAVVSSPFESAELPECAFDLAVCATSYHWLDPRIAPRKLGACLRPGGRLALFWNVFQDPVREDPFHDATRDLLSQLGTSPSHGGPGGSPFALDQAARRSDFVAAGVIEDFEVEVLSWTLHLTSREVRALYATYSPIARLEAREREPLLDSLATVAEAQFGGHVERPMLTPVYTGRKEA